MLFEETLIDPIIMYIYIYTILTGVYRISSATAEYEVLSNYCDGRGQSCIRYIYINIPTTHDGRVIRSRTR